MKKSTHVTLHDIAKKLNVSTVTVSKALRNHPDISKETRQRIAQYAEELDYTPNFSARNLSSSRSRMIGLIIPNLSDVFFPAIIKTMCNAAYNNGYDMLTMFSYENVAREIHHIKTLLSLRVDGILIAISEQTEDRKIFKTVKNMGVPLVFFARVIDDIGFSYVKQDDRLAAFKTVDYAIKAGYTRIAHLAGYSFLNIGRDRSAGYIDVMRKHNLPISKHWLIENGLSEEHGYQGFMNLYKNKNLPEIIFAVTYSVALGAYHAALKVGLKIPDDIDIVYIGTVSGKSVIPSSFSVFSQPEEAIGNKAVEILIDEIKHPENFKQQQVELQSGL